MCPARTEQAVHVIRELAEGREADIADSSHAWGLRRDADEQTGRPGSRPATVVRQTT
jgi:hypothetical protein